MMRMDFNKKSGSLVLLLALIVIPMLACGTSVDSAGEDPQKWVKILTDPNENSQNRKKAAEALGNLGDPIAVEPLLLTLAECDKTERAWCQNVIMALGKLKDPRAVDPLIKLLDSAAYKEIVIRVLSELGDPGAIVPLIQTVYTDTLNTKKKFRSEKKTLSSYDSLLIPVTDLAKKGGSKTVKPIREALPQLDVDPPEIEDIKSLDATCLQYRLGISALLATQSTDIETILGSELETSRNCAWLLPHAFAKLYNYDEKKLLPYLKSEDVITASQFARILVHIGAPGTEEALISVLDRCTQEAGGDKLFCANAIAAEYLYSKNDKLSKAAGQWAQQQNYKFSKVGPGYAEYSGPIWNDLKYDPYFK